MPGPDLQQELQNAPHGHEGRSLPGQHQRGGGRPAHRGTCDSIRGRDPVNAVRYLLLIGGDLVDTARYLLLTGGDPVEAARQPLLTGCDTCGELVNALPHHVERYCVQLLLIGRGGGQPDRIGSVLRSWWGLRRHPAKLRVRVCDHLSRRVAVGLSSQRGSCTDAKRQHKTRGARHGTHLHLFPLFNRPPFV